MNAICEHYELVVVGGGMAGLCTAIAAAREGVKTVLIQNRPVLGGNASSEIRMHICGADYHMTRANARETGIIEEILLEHKYRNENNSYAIFDSILWEKATFQENLTLHLNTHMTSVHTVDKIIQSIEAIQVTTEKKYTIYGKIFVDATGDASLGEQAGADYVVGREANETYQEAYAKDLAEPYTMGNTLMFKAKDIGKPVKFVKPFWANTYTEEDLKLRDHQEVTSGYWWIELGGKTLDIVKDGEVLRDELLKAVFGVWDHLKNTGNHGTENLDLEWVGFLPGKRDSRRLLGDYVLNQNDCVAGRRFEDAVAYGGWPMDIHTVEGFKENNEEPTVWLGLEDVYTIPYRSLYSRNITNLMMAGRNISCSHIAFASARVMATCAVVGQAVGTGASIAIKEDIPPREVLNHIGRLQQKLLKNDCYIPGISNHDNNDLARNAIVKSSSHILGNEAENVINGIARMVDQEENSWKTVMAASPWIDLTLAKHDRIREIRITFDSNLSREITISLSDTVLRRESKSTPEELIKDYELRLFDGDTCVYSKVVTDNYLRHNVIQLEEGVYCNRIQVKMLATNGAEEVKVFEIRAYA